MSRTEFIERLQRALAGGLSSGQVAENIRYYQEYIDSEVSSGKKEADVLAQLGDPRLLAKSIIEANKHAGVNYGSNREYDEEVSGDRQEQNSARAAREKIVMLPGWLIMLIVTVVVILIIGVVTSLLYLLAPVIIVALVVLLIVKVFQSNSR